MNKLIVFIFFVFGIKTSIIFDVYCSHQYTSDKLNSKNFNLTDSLSSGIILSNAAIERTKHDITYDGSYVNLQYPNGDVPSNIGVCTDVVIRSYRNAFNIDLQKEIHEDMRDNFEKYPSKKIWGNTTTDRNIDHRRTQNLECFLTRVGAKLPITNNPKDYKPGDLVFWADIATGHVGIVVNQYTEQNIPKVVHNIGDGPKCEDFLFKNRIIGHYRWLKHK